METLQPQIGVVTIVVKGRQIMFAKRLKPIGYGQWCLPGGHLEMYETFEECAIRETQEEAGIEIKNIQFLTARNNRYPDHSKHYITIVMIAEWASGEPTVSEEEREKHGDWQWFYLDELPDPLFETHIIFSNYTQLRRIWDYMCFHVGGKQIDPPPTGNTVEKTVALLSEFVGNLRKT